MNIVAYTVLGVAALLVGFQLWTFLRARRQEGAAAPDFADLVPAELAGAPKLLFYFYSEQCGPCRALAPTIQALAAQHRHLIKVDVVRRPEGARRFKVMGTPTFVLVERGRIARVILGPVSAQTLAALLQ